MRKIDPPQMNANMTYSCPVCGEAMRHVESCGAYVCDNLCDVYFLSYFTPIIDNNPYKPIIEESAKHYDNAWAKKEMEAFGLSEDDLKKFSVGFYPCGYWPWKNDDSSFGTLVFPLVGWKGEYVNVLGKHVGKDDKLDLTKAIHKLDKNSKGVFNMPGFWNEEVHVYTNPTECLKAILSGHENSICVFDGIKLPEVLPVKQVFIHSPEEIPVDDIVKTFSDAGIKTA